MYPIWSRAIQLIGHHSQDLVLEPNFETIFFLFICVVFDEYKKDVTLVISSVSAREIASWPEEM